MKDYTAMAKDESFPKQFHLRTQSEFDAVYHNDVFAADEVLVIQANKNGFAYSRLGLSIGRKVGNAVQRNRWKRVIREAFRKRRNQLPVGLDIVVRPRKGAVCESAPVAQSLEQLVKRIAKKLGPGQVTAPNRAQGELK
jgi:ribonuclease P protein component